MAETRNIKDLPQTDAMTSGDYFLIEAPAGTQLLAFDNFVIDEDNTTFATDLLTNMTTLSTQVTAVSSDMDLTGANASAKLYLVNTQLTERMDAFQDVLYGSDGSFEAQITDFISANPGDPITTDDRGLNGNLKALSAMIFDELYTRMVTMSASIVGDENNHIQETRDLVYSGQGGTNITLNNGGLLGALLDTVRKTVDVRLTEMSATFNSSNKDSAVLSFAIPSRYVVNRGSLQFNIEFTNEVNLSVGGDNPYTNPGTFVTVGYTTAPAGQDEVLHSWTVKRVGGAIFTDDEYPIRLNGRVVSSA
jgi:hypothetical protein